MRNIQEKIPESIQDLVELGSFGIIQDEQARLRVLHTDLYLNMPTELDFSVFAGMNLFIHPLALPVEMETACLLSVTDEGEYTITRGKINQ